MRTWQLLYWMSAGGLIGFGLIGILSIGFPFLLVGLGMVIYGAVRRWMDTFWLCCYSNHSICQLPQAMRCQEEMRPG